MKTKLRNCIPHFLLVMAIASGVPSETITEIEIPEAKETAVTEPEKAYWPTDSWRESAPAEQGMDAVLLQNMLGEIDQQGLEIDSLLVVRNGCIVTEKYYSPYEKDTLHGVYSVTKSVVSALIWIAIDEGYINSVDDPVMDYFPR